LFLRTDANVFPSLAGAQVGSATRAAMRAGNLPHRASFVFLHNSAGKLFVQQRVAWKETYPSHHDPAPVRRTVFALRSAAGGLLTRRVRPVQGGVVDAGESYEANAEREVEEEMGVSGVPLTPLFDFFFQDGVSRVWGRAFRAVYDGPLRLQASEVAGGTWLELAEVAALVEAGPVCPDSAAAFREYARRIAAGDLALP